jgi:hypothetical protein
MLVRGATQESKYKKMIELVKNKLYTCTIFSNAQHSVATLYKPSTSLITISKFSCFFFIFIAQTEIVTLNLEVRQRKRLRTAVLYDSDVNE